MVRFIIDEQNSVRDHSRRHVLGGREGNTTVTTACPQGRRASKCMRFEMETKTSDSENSEKFPVNCSRPSAPCGSLTSRRTLPDIFCWRVAPPCFAIPTFAHVFFVFCVSPIGSRPLLLTFAPNRTHRTHKTIFGAQECLDRPLLSCPRLERGC